MIARLKLWLMALAGAVLAFMGVYLAGRQAGQTREVRRRVEVMREANEVQDEVNDMGADARRDGLARWMRDE
jgi:hypothetical protein